MLWLEARMKDDQLGVGVGGVASGLKSAYAEEVYRRRVTFKITKTQREKTLAGCQLNFELSDAIVPTYFYAEKPWACQNARSWRFWSRSSNTAQVHAPSTSWCSSTVYSVCLSRLVWNLTGIPQQLMHIPIWNSVFNQHVKTKHWLTNELSFSTRSQLSLLNIASIIKNFDIKCTAHEWILLFLLLAHITYLI